MGVKTGSRRTVDQTHIAYFFNGYVTNDYVEAAIEIARARQTSRGKNSRIFALLAIALHDTSVTVFRAKRDFGMNPADVTWRPILAIPKADLDGNPNTAPMSGWVPLITTPNHPEYPASHPGSHGAGPRVLQHFFGDVNAFEVHPAFNTVFPGPPEGGVQPRRYRRISDMAQEGIDARTYGGMHFRGASKRQRWWALKSPTTSWRTPRDRWTATTPIRNSIGVCRSIEEHPGFPGGDERGGGMGGPSEAPHVTRSAAPLAVEAAVLDGLRAVLGGDGVGAGEVGDGAGHPDDAVVAAGREAEAFGGGVEELSGVGAEREESPQEARRQLGIGPQPGAGQPLSLALARARARGSGCRRSSRPRRGPGRLTAGRRAAPRADRCGRGAAARAARGSAGARPGCRDTGRATDSHGGRDWRPRRAGSERGIGRCRRCA